MQNAAFACDTSSGAPFRLFGSFDPSATLGDCFANLWVIDLQSAGASLPAWWDFKGAGRCRGTSMSQNTDFTRGPFTCFDPWAGLIRIQGFGYNYTGPNSVRVIGIQELHVWARGQVDAGTEYYSFELVINRAKTTGVESCAGCQVPVCLVLNEITVLDFYRGEAREQTPRDRNYVTWQGGAIAAPGCPLATPTRNRSWGQLKSLYR